LQQVHRLRIGSQPEHVLAFATVVMGKVHQARFDGDGRLFKDE
jgi:hypothetical protein